MKSRRARKRIFAVVVLCAAAGACAVQTAWGADVTVQGAFVFDPGICETATFASAPQECLADIGRQMLDPDLFAHPLSNTNSPQAKTLPGVPTAVAMTVFGFVCVSLCRDRRAWFAIAGGILWLGQAGVHTVPQLANRICARTIRRTAPNKSLSFSHTIAVRPTACNEEIIYAGLLHKLGATPDDPASFASNSNAKASAPVLATGGQRSAYATAPGGPWQDTVNECPTSTTEHRVRFSPAFIFDNLARGPPADSL
ncbi:MAG TPA: hypothetical protein P5279_11810 [Anaerohalosphaeraceae bacterium]|nr:hypothetical protein [Anaerohalosphaeraceae bacterium]HRT51174.1 hypothetical protein [Anaerohalosphaeraceae bacterium]HRT87227.1 hypothetical protein [Anaerohalosphaeraceae bacterium]